MKYFEYFFIQREKKMKSKKSRRNKMGSDDDDSDYDMDSDPDEYDIEYESEDDQQETIDEINKNHPKQAYELIERNLIFGLMNRTLEELNSITGISNVSPIIRFLLMEK